MAGPQRSPVARGLGWASLGLVGVAIVAELFGRGERMRSPPAPEAALSRRLHGSAALLGACVLADSALEHYRGRFRNPGMVAPLLASLWAGVSGARQAAARDPASIVAARAPYVCATGVGVAGLGFHLYDVGRRAGGFNWQNVFYAAPLGAPAALCLAGLTGLAARRIAATPPAGDPRWLGVPASRSLSALAAAGLAGTVGEVALLHFRGAFHHPAMWLPVTLPPVAAALMAASAIAPGRDRRRESLARAGLVTTALLGLAGVAFHARGVSRQMGGWRNWRQNLLSGPPLPAPPAFSALGVAGLAALSLARRDGAGRPA